jgi:TolB-like protein/Flp pilus assembly protein TadD
VAEASHAVFLSYASQDAEAARRICEALRGAGIEVWFDQSELRGGDAWDQKIRRQIHDCVLFIPVISSNTASRHEGYFRLEWDLADQRTHMIARNRPFIVPVCLDATPDAGADVPESFHRVQWTRLPAGETPPAFVERVRRLLSPEAPAATRPPASTMSGAIAAVREPIRASRWAKPLPLAIVAIVAVAALAYVVANKFWVSKHATSGAAPASAAAAAFNPPPHSIAVLPFVNMSGDPTQEYFSEGLTEELLNSLSRINELQVAARTSSFSFQGEHPDIATVAHKLNVASVLEGSVRRSGHNIRITAQLNNGITGFRVWSQTFDRDLGDVLKLQTEIAAAVAAALKITLLGSLTERIELGGTHNPAAFDAYLRGSKAFSSIDDVSNLKSAISEYAEAIRLDPNYALAFAGRSLALASYGWEFATGPAIREFFDKAQTDARAALKLAPELAEGHLALATYFNRGALDFTHANEAYERAAALAPGNAEVLADSGRFAVIMGRFDAGLAAGRRAVALDPLGPRSRYLLAQALYLAHRNEESVATFGEVISLEPDHKAAYGFRGLAYYGLGDFQSARASCETKPDNWASEWCLAVTYDKLGRHADAEAVLTKFQRVYGDAGLVEYATIYAQWGNTTKALEWLTTAMRLRSPDLAYVRTDPLLDPLRQEPRFQAVMRELKFPE